MAISTKYPTEAKRTFLLKRVKVRPIGEDEREDWKSLMDEHHPLGVTQFPGHQIFYVAEHCGKAVGLLSYSACAYHLADRDRWIGWTREQKEIRKNFVVQNSRFLVLPGEKNKNLPSKILSLCEKRLASDWENKFGFRPLLMETFVDPLFHTGISYRAAGWTHIGETAGFRRSSDEFYAADSTPKYIFTKELHPSARELLRSETLPEKLRPFECPLPDRVRTDQFGADRLRSLFQELHGLNDFRRAGSRRYPLGTCLALVVCGVMAGRLTMRECAEMAKGFNQRQRGALRCWRNPKTKRYETPSYGTLWRVLNGTDAEAFETAVSRWFNDVENLPKAFAIDGKVLRATLLNKDGGVCAVSAVPHASHDAFFFEHVLTESKGKEIRASRELIGHLPDLNGATVTLDALHTVEETFRQVVEGKNGDVLVCVKDNAKALRRRIVEALSENGGETDFASTTDIAHGRIEKRSIRTLPTTPPEMNWSHAHVIGEVVRETQYVRDGETYKTTSDTAHYVGTISSYQCSAAKLLALVRGHWGIETTLHHRKDRSMDEDRNRAGRQGIGRAMCFLRSMAALIMGKCHESTKVIQARIGANLSSLVAMLKSSNPTTWMRKLELCR